MIDTRHVVVRALLADRQVTDADVRRAAERAAKEELDILDALVANRSITQRKLAIARAKICEYPFVDLANYDVDIRNARFVPRATADRLCAFPLFVTATSATVAILDPMNLAGVDQLRQVMKLDVDPVIVETDQLRALIKRAYSFSVAADGGSTQTGGDETNLTTGEEPIVAAVNQILAGAIDCNASDVHINPDDRELHLRYRVDGVMQVRQGPAKSAHSGIVQRLKVLAKLDLAQTRKPQDGKFRFQPPGAEPVDIRLSVLPTIHGENVVMRLLRGARRITSIEELGMPAEMTTAYQRFVTRPHGMILVTGPTGSGKTTTLYTALHAINTPERNIMTIEDPVEIRLPMVRQVQVNPEIGLTFASALRSMVRQDPDVMLVGEIRDEETAKIALQAALTGHLVFSTLHTNDAPGAITRLRDLGVPRFAIYGALLCSIAQRLVRRLCRECARPDPSPDVSMLGVRTLPEGEFLSPGGCPACGASGYRGRLGVYEMLRMSQRLQSLLERDATRQEIETSARLDGYRPMLEDGLAKAARGLTTIQELGKLRATLDEAPPALQREAA